MTVTARIEARLRSLTARERLLLLLCALAVVSFAVVRWAVFPAVEQHRKERALISARRATLARYRMVQKGRSEVTERLADLVEELGTAEEGLLKGSDPSAAGAALQGMLKPMVNRQDTRLTSVRTMQTSTEGLASLLAGIPRQQKILRVKKLTVRSGIHSAALANRPDKLTVSLTVSGMTAAPEEVAVPKGEKE
jgi:hypothetical protein